MCEEIRFAMLISRVTSTFSCSKMCSNTKADAAILDIFVRKKNLTAALLNNSYFL